MREPSPDQFARTLADLSQPALVAFVADLWRARGWETRVDASEGDRRIVCTRDDEVTTLLVPARESDLTRLRRGVRSRVRKRADSRGRDAAVTTDIDVVVSPAASARATTLADACDARLHDSHSLYELALYGVARHEADAVFRRHLGVGIEARPDPPAEEAPPADGPSGWVSSGGVGRNLDTMVTGLVILVLVVAGIGVGVGFGADRDGTLGAFGDAGDAGESVPTPDAGAGTGVGSGPSSTAATDTDTEVLLAPGLASRGQVDPDVLARAHADAVDGRSYVWRVRYEEAGESDANATAVHRVQSATRLRVDLETSGTLATDPGRLVPRPAYADGDTRYVLFQDQILQRPPETSDHYAGHARRALAALLRANETDITDALVVRGTVRYRVSLMGSPDGSKREYWATAFVSPEGVIYLFEAQWVDPETNVTVSVRSAYDFVDDPAVTRPEWVGAASDGSTPRPTAEPTATSTAESPTAPANESTPTAASVPAPSSSLPPATLTSPVSDG